MNTGTYNLDQHLFAFSANGKSTPFTVREAVNGCCILGCTGSGKTSGSSRRFALSYLSAGFGGLVLTVKREERALWEEYARATNRTQDLVIVSPGGNQFFDFLTYEASSRDGVSYTQNLVNVLKTVIQAGEEKSTGKSDDQFWAKALDMLMFHVIDLCLLAYGKLSVRQLYDVAIAAPKKGLAKEDGQKDSFIRAFEAAQKKVDAQVTALMGSLSDAERVKAKDPTYFEAMLLDTLPDAVRLRSIDQFFIEIYRILAEKTRSIIDFMFGNFLFSLLQEPMYSLFCRHASTFTPEDCFNGKIILIDLPVKLYNEAGRDVQVLFKYIWQRAVEKRDTARNDRPVFLFADEAQHFLHEYDAEYQATARSSRIATVYISQNLANFFGNMGGDGRKSEHKVHSLLGNLATKIFHCNSDLETNRFAADMIGEGYTEDVSRGVNVAGEFGANRNVSYILEKMVRPEIFGLLKTGGPENDYCVEGYVHRQGRTFDNGQNFKKITFKQNR